MMHPHEFVEGLEWHNQGFYEFGSHFNCGRKFDFR
jgi:hypothetical protein